jgi:hypothetical protein
MIPDWVTWDHAKDVVQGIGYIAVVWYTHRRTTTRLDKQDAELKKQSQGLEWNNEATELTHADLVATIASGKVSLPPPSKTPSPLPPRPKVATLTDPFETYVEQAKALDESRKK